MNDQLKFRAAVIDRCIAVLRIVECRFEYRRIGTFSHGKDLGAREQHAACIAALELFKEGPQALKEAPRDPVSQ